MNSGIIHTHFDVAKAPLQQRLLAWRERVGHVIDILPSRIDFERPFSASIDRYQAGELALTHCRSDELLLERSIARVSTDRSRGFAFHVFLSGCTSQLSVYNHARYSHAKENEISKASILVLDLDQPVRMHRRTCEVLTFFVGRALVEEMFPHAEALHGRVLTEDASTLTRLIVQHALLLARDLPHMDEALAQEAIRNAVSLIVAALGKQAQLTGSARSAAKAVIYAQVKQYIHKHIDCADLSPEKIVAELKLSRPTLYRLFQHEGGLAAYIRHLRLRHAVSELTQHIHADIAEIAYGLGFGSPSDFSRAFRRAYDIAPQELRMLSFSRGATPMPIQFAQA